MARPFHTALRHARANFWNIERLHKDEDRWLCVVSSRHTMRGADIQTYTLLWQFIYELNISCPTIGWQKLPEHILLTRSLLWDDMPTHAHRNFQRFAKRSCTLAAQLGLPPILDPDDFSANTFGPSGHAHLEAHATFCDLLPWQPHTVRLTQTIIASKDPRSPS